MRVYELPDGSTIDLDNVTSVGKVFVNKNFSKYNCYEIFLSGQNSVSVFEDALPRATFIGTWSGG